MYDATYVTVTQVCAVFFSISEGKHDMQNTSSQGNGQTSIKDKNHIAINAYEEIVDVPVYSKPLSTSNPMFLQTEKVKHSSLSSKKSLSSQRSFENLQEDIPLHVFDEKNKISENKSSNNRSRNHSLNENRSDHSSGKYENDNISLFRFSIKLNVMSK